MSCFRLKVLAQQLQENGFSPMCLQEMWDLRLKFLANASPQCAQMYFFSLFKLLLLLLLPEWWAEW